MYLTDVTSGGETVFPKVPVPEGQTKEDGFSECAMQGLAVKPKKGDAVLFWSIRPDGTFDPASLHGSCPVITGEKWSATKWCVCLCVFVGLVRRAQLDDACCFPTLKQQQHPLHSQKYNNNQNKQKNKGSTSRTTRRRASGVKRWSASSSCRRARRRPTGARTTIRTCARSGRRAASARATQVCGVLCFCLCCVCSACVPASARNLIETRTRQLVTGYMVGTKAQPGACVRSCDRCEGDRCEGGGCEGGGGSSGVGRPRRSLG